MISKGLIPYTQAKQTSDKKSVKDIEIIPDQALFWKGNPVLNGT